MRKLTNFFLGALLGGFVGAIFSLLFTRESGVEFRNRLRQRTIAFSNDIRQAVNTKRIELEGRLDSLRTPPAE